MSGIAYDIDLDGATISSSARDTSAVLLRLRSALTMDAGGWCTLVLAAGDATPPAIGGSVTVSLDAGDGAATVFTGEVVAVSATADKLRVDACDGLAKLGRVEIEEAFEEQSAGAIARALLDAAGLSAGDVDDGPTFPSYVLHRGPAALTHLRRLAEQCGVDVFTDGAGKVHFAGPATRGARHTFKAKEQILEVELRRLALPRDGVDLWGEGAASSEGAAKAHWLIADLRSVAGKASIGDDGEVRGSAGARPASIRDGAARSGEVADTLARARAAAIAARRIAGHVKVLGAPSVTPGDTITLDDLDAYPGLAALAGDDGLRVRKVHHLVAADRGYVTRMEF